MVTLEAWVDSVVELAFPALIGLCGLLNFIVRRSGVKDECLF